MNEHAVRCFALISACNARIEGMKAENDHRKSIGQSIAYGEEAFNVEANLLEQYAFDVIQQ